MTFRGGRDVALEKRLKQELLPKSDAYVRYVALLFRGRDGSPGEPQLQSLRKAMIAAIDDHLHFVGRNPQLAAGAGERPPLPFDIAERLRLALVRSADGEPDPLFEPYRLPGGRGNLARSERRVWVERAVDYLTVVDLGLVNDRRSRQRVADSYGISRRQVQRWLKSAGVLRQRAAALKKRSPLRNGMTRDMWELQIARNLRFFVDHYQEMAGRNR